MRLAALCRLLRPLHARPRPRPLHSGVRLQTPLPIAVPIAPPTPKPARASPLPVTPLCPPPRCPCEPAPAGLDIDRTTPLSGTMANYHRHLLISTGKSDWASKIEFDEPGGLAAKVKAVASLKGGGNLRDPFAPTLITNSSFAEPGAYVFPSGVHIAHIAPTTAAITALIRGFLLPPPHAASAAPGFEVREVRETVVLICSHMSRDVRCGTLAPLLRTQFETVLAARDVLLTPEHEARGAYEGRVKVGFTSHLSGHKFAGNVIVYLPGSAEEAGLGVWYGRVEPRHVEGIVEETVLGRRVIGELCRGVVEGGQGGQGGQSMGGAGGQSGNL